MNVLLLRGNPRKDGYTAYLTNLFLQGLHSTDASVTDVDLPARSIRPCDGCYACWTASPGRCKFRDDMDDLLEAVYAADVIVAATPLYYYAMSGAMKVFFERTLPVTQPGFDRGPSGLVRNALTRPDRWDKSLIGLVAGALKSEKNFGACVRTFELIADGLHMRNGGVLIRPESYLLQFELSKPKTVKVIEAAFIQAGRQAGLTGHVPADLLEKAATPLAVDMPHFETYSNIYWEHATAMGARAADLNLVQRKVVGDVRILMREMARSIDPVATKRVKAVLQFDFPDKALHYRLAVDRGRCELIEAETETPDLRVTCTTEIWAGVFTREVDVKAALRDRQIRLDGDRFLFSRLDRYFPPPTA